MYTAQGTLQRDDLIERSRPMVRRIANQMMARLPASVDVEDLVQAGMMGLFDAIGRYDAASGAQFETFASQRVRGAMLDELRANDWMPRSVRKSQRTIEQAIRKVEQREHRPATEAEIAAELGLPLADYQQMLGDARGGQLIYLDEMGGGDADEGYLERNHPSTEPTPLDHVQDVRFRKALIEAIQELPERERLMMSLYYEQDLNLKEIGAVLGVTESRVSQLHSQSVSRIRTRLRSWL